MGGPGIGLNALVAVCRSHGVEFAVEDGVLKVRGDPSKMPAEFRAVVKARLPDIRRHLGIPDAAPAPTPASPPPAAPPPPPCPPHHPPVGSPVVPSLFSDPRPQGTPPLLPPVPATSLPANHPSMPKFPEVQCSREGCKEFAAHPPHLPSVLDRDQALRSVGVVPPTLPPITAPPPVAEKSTVVLASPAVVDALSSPRESEVRPVAECFKCNLEYLVLIPSELDVEPNRCYKCGGLLMAGAPAPQP